MAKFKPQSCMRCGKGRKEVSLGTYSFQRFVGGRWQWYEADFCGSCAEDFNEFVRGAREWGSPSLFGGDA